MHAHVLADAGWLAEQHAAHDPVWYLWVPIRQYLCVPCVGHYLWVLIILSPGTYPPMMTKSFKAPLPTENTEKRLALHCA